MRQPNKNLITYDLNNTFGEDLVLEAGNDLDNVSDVTKSQQRIQRRLLTNPGAYIWHTEYGAGLGRFIGQALSNDLYNEIQSLILSQIYLEDSVAQNPTPVITLQTIQMGLLVQIAYTVDPVGTPVVYTFAVQN